MAVETIIPTGSYSNLIPTTFGIDSPSEADGSGKFDGKNPFLQGKLPYNTEKTEYAANKSTDNGTGDKEIQTVKNKHAPNADKPTTASADASMLKLPDILAKVDPKQVAQILKGMMKLLSLVNSVMDSNSNTATNNNIIDGLTDALTVLTKTFGFTVVIEAFNLALNNNGLYSIGSQYQSLVINALLNLITQAIQFGENNIPTPIIPPIIYGTIIPSPLVTTIPSLYIQQFYTTDPYIGYIQYQGPNGDFVYVIRQSNQPPFTNLNDQLVYISMNEIIQTITPYIANYTLTTSIINLALSLQQTNISNNKTEASLGKDTSINLMQLLTTLLGKLSTILNLAKSLHIPNSVLNQSAINTTLQTFSKNMALVKKMKSQAQSAFKLAESGNVLGTLSSLTNSLSSYGISIPALNSINDIIKTVSPLLNIINLSASQLNASSTASTPVANTINIDSVILALKNSGASNNDLIYAKSLLQNLHVGT